MKTKHNYPPWALAHRKPGTELRFINNSYYLYEVFSKYDPKKKRGKKVTGKLLGKITESQGFIDSAKKLLAEKSPTTIDIANISVREQGITMFLDAYNKEIGQKLKDFFPELYQIIIYMAYCRLVHQSPIKNMQLHISKTMLSIDDKEQYFDKKISDALLKIGQNRDAANSYMKSFVAANDHVMIDMTNIFSGSQNIRHVKEGYNSDMVFDTQFNLMYIYSPKLQQPVFYRLFDGNTKEVSGFKTCLLESGIDNAIIVADKGFYSKANIENLEANQLKYIIPLRRDNTLIQYELLNETTNEYIKFGDRFVWAHHYMNEGQQIYIFKDEKLKVQEQKDYLDRIESKLEGYTREKYNERIKLFGTLTFVSNLKDITCNEVYTTYKSRNEIEVLYDGLKNILHADRTYMQNEDRLFGWMFINHIALQWYYIIYKMLKESNYLKKCSVTEFVKHLYEIKKVRINNNWYNEPIIKATTKMLTDMKVYSVK